MTNGDEQPHEQPDAADVALGLDLLRLGARLYRLQMESLEQLTTPLSLRQFRIINRVHDGITSLGRLTELARRQPSTISKSVDSLVRQGLLTRRAADGDRRAVVLELTPEGAELWREAHRAVEDLASRLLRDSRLSRAALRRTIETLYERSEEIGVGAPTP